MLGPSTKGLPKSDASSVDHYSLGVSNSLRQDSSMPLHFVCFFVVARICPHLGVRIPVGVGEWTLLDKLLVKICLFFRLKSLDFLKKFDPGFKPPFV